MNSRKIQSQAAAWIARVSGRQSSAEEREALRAWCLERPEHEAAYVSAEQAWADLAAMGESPKYRGLLGAPTWRERLIAALHRPSRAAWLGAGITGIAALIAVTLWYRPLGLEPSPRPQARVAAAQETVLADGTHVTLGPEARLEVKFAADARRVTLISGEAFFSVTKDPSRPFLVSAGSVQIRVVGTQFEVRERSDAITVAVAEGVVELSTPAQTSAPIRKLTRGNSATAELGGAPITVQSVDPAAIGAWRDGRLVYDNVELRDVVADANRYTDARIIIADAALADLRVTLAYRASQVGEMLETLERAFPIDIEYLQGGGRVLHARP
jgi:transmembrane sensor